MAPSILAPPFMLRAGALPPDSFRVMAFRGREALSRPFRWEITAAATFADEPPASGELLGQPARLEIDAGAVRRVVHGVVVRVEAAGVATLDRRTFVLRIAPRLALLRHRTTTRIFQEKSTPEIVTAVLSEHGIVHRWEILGRYPVHSYCTQYEEPDLDFVERLLAESGLYYAFEPPAAGSPMTDAETLLIADAAQYRPIEGDARLLYRPASRGSAMSAEEHHVHSFSRSRRTAPGAYARRDYDFARPLLPLSSRAERLGPGLELRAEVYEHHGAHAEAESEAGLARSALEQLQRRAALSEGRGACRRLIAGQRFVLDEHDSPSSHDGEYVVTAVRHVGRSPEVAGTAAVYENRFEAIAATEVQRPPRPRRQVRQSLETAAVVGPAGQEIHTDAQGRVKVQFHWDREGQLDERSSCWIRVAQAWSGTGWGTQIIPRIGMEVLVAFVGGDPDRPMIIGCVPNTTHPLPYSLPENASKSGIKSQTTPGGGGFNELLFDDQKGGELLALRAERNLTETVLHDRSASVGHDDSASIAGDRTVEVHGADSLRVEGALSCAVRGGATVSIGGSAGGTVGGDRSTAVAGNDSTRVGGGMTVIATEYLHQLIGHGAPAGHGLLYANGNYRIGAAGTFDSSAAKGITLSCGESHIEILPDEVKIRTPRLTLIATEAMTAQGKDNALSMGERVELRGADVRIFGKDSSLILDDDGKLNGQKVKLNCDKPKPEKKNDEAEEEMGTITFKVKPHFPVQPGDRLVAVIATPAGETIEKDVDANLEVKLEGKKGETFVLVDLRKGDLPFGKRG